jgi:hypothetical protein
MGSIGMPFARNVEFETTFPDLGETALTRNRHGNRLGLLKPDPQVISRVLLTRSQSIYCDGLDRESAWHKSIYDSTIITTRRSHSR